MIVAHDARCVALGCQRSRIPRGQPSVPPPFQLTAPADILSFLARPGNDPELDPNRPAPPPARAVDRPAARHGKRDAPKEAPVSQPRENNGGNRRGGRAPAGNEAGM